MRKPTFKTVEFGQLVVDAFDKALSLSADPREVSRLATQALIRMLARARQPVAPDQFQPVLAWARA